MVSLEQVRLALISLGISTDKIDSAIESLREFLRDLDQVEVKGRQTLDTLLGCMMATEAILGEREVS